VPSPSLGPSSSPVLAPGPGPGRRPGQVQVSAAELVRAAAAVASPALKYLSAFGPTLDASNEVLPGSGVEQLMNDACRERRDGSVQLIVIVTSCRPNHIIYADWPSQASSSPLTSERDSFDRY